MDFPDLATWQKPIPGDLPCGPDLSYDAEFLALGRSLAGRPESQFAPAAAPVWHEVRTQAEQLLDRTRDLRVAIAWTRAAVHLFGVMALAPALALIASWLEQFWPSLHPALDATQVPDNPATDLATAPAIDAPTAPLDPEAALTRLTVLTELDQFDGLFSDLANAPLGEQRPLSGFQLRLLAPISSTRDPSGAVDPALIGLLRDHPTLAADLLRRIADARHHLARIHHVLQTRPEAAALRTMPALEGAFESPRLSRLLADAHQRLDQAAGTPAISADINTDDPAIDTGTSAELLSGPPIAPARVTSTAAPPPVIRNRADATHWLRQVREFLERTEPSHPAPWLLLRAERLMDKNFLQLVLEFSPEASASVARALGVDPDALVTAPSG